MSKKETSIFYKTKRREVPKDEYVKPSTPPKHIKYAEESIDEIVKESGNGSNGSDKNKQDIGVSGGNLNDGDKSGDPEAKNIITQMKEKDKKISWWWFILFLLLLYLLVGFFSNKDFIKNITDNHNPNNNVDRNIGNIDGGTGGGSGNRVDNSLYGDINDGDNKSESKTISHLIIEEDLNKGIVSEEHIDKYRNNENNKIENIGDINGDGFDDYIVISEEAIKNNLIEDKIIYTPIKPLELSCSKDVYTNDWYKENIGYTKMVEDYVDINHNKNKITVAVVDTGVSLHKDLKGVISYSDSFDIEDNNGHGTSVAGVITSVNPNAKIIPIKISDEDKIPGINVILGLKRAIDINPDIINLSFSVDRKNLIIEKLIDKAIDKGIIVVAATGNDSSDSTKYFPSGYDGVISIGSNSFDNTISDFSNYGDRIDFLTPGECIYTTHLDNSYERVSGTSFSAPIMSGIISLYLEQNRNDFDTMLNKLKETATINEDGYKIPNVESFLSLNESDLLMLIEYWKNKYINLLRFQIDENIEKLGVYLETSNTFYNGLNNDNLENKFSELEKVYIDSDLLNSLKRLKYSDEIFDTDKLNKAIFSLNDLFGNKNTTVSIDQNKLLESVGIKVLGDENNKDTFFVLIKQGEELPTKSTGSFSTTKELQESILFKIYQGRNSNAEENTYLGNLKLEGLIPTKEKQSAALELSVDKNGTLNVKVTDNKNKENIASVILEGRASFITNNLYDIDKIKEKIKQVDDDIKGLKEELKNL